MNAAYTPKRHVYRNWFYGYQTAVESVKEWRQLMFSTSDDLDWDRSLFFEFLTRNYF